MISIIELKGKFYVQFSILFLWKSYLDAKSFDYFWCIPEYVDKYCKFDTAEDAEAGYKKYKMRGKRIKVLRVFGISL